MFGVPNVKYLAFGTPDENALTNIINKKSINFLCVFVSKGNN